MNPGTTYYFRAFANSPDGSDWSSGDPQVIDDLLAFWRLDEESGAFAYDSSFPMRTAKFEGFENNSSRPDGFHAKGLKFDGGSNWLNLDYNSTGFLENSFEGRSVSFRFKPTQKVYAGPSVTKYDKLSAYFPFDEGSGNLANDISENKLKGTGSGGVSWGAGQFNQSISMDGINDFVSLETPGVLKEFHKESYTISLGLIQRMQHPACTLREG